MIIKRIAGATRLLGRSQGFPRGYTAGQADGPRYKQLGNSWAVNVARWIGERIDAALRRQREEAA